MKSLILRRFPRSHVGLTRLTGHSAFVAGSPLLLHNIVGDETDLQSVERTTLSICSSPFGSKSPAIPVARAATIARVASPLTINRQYQSLFTNGLKKYFDCGKKLMKQGDLFAIPIATDLSRVPANEDIPGASDGGGMIVR